MTRGIEMEQLYIIQIFLKAQGLYEGVIDAGMDSVVITATFYIDKHLDPHWSKKEPDNYLTYYETILLVKEFCEIYMNAPLLTGLEQEGYRELLRWNKVVLAAKLMSSTYLQLVVWNAQQNPHEYNFGRYFKSDYKAAKREFAVLSGLISEDEEWDEEGE